MRALTRVLGFAAVLAFATVLLAPPAASHAAEEAESDVPQITDRYESIDNLTTARNSDERVVVDTSVGVLTSTNRALNGLAVRFSGEAVGDVLAGDADHKWVNVVGASGASIGVYMSTEQAEQIVNLGDYNTTGSTIEVEGTYSIACSEHQGELDVHATSVKVLDVGGKITRPVSQQRLVVALVLCAAGAVLLGTFALLRRRSNQKARR